MADFRKYLIILVIGVIFSVLVFATIAAVYEPPKYENYCKSKLQPIPEKLNYNCTNIRVEEEFVKDCEMRKGYIDYTYDSSGCAVSYECNTCQNEFEIGMQKYQRVKFYVSAIMALIAIFLGLYLPAKENSLNEWIGTGFMLGGVFALFFGTVSSYNALDRIFRPFVMLAELVIVILIAYKQVGKLRPEKNHKKR